MRVQKVTDVAGGGGAERRDRLDSGERESSRLGQGTCKALQEHQEDPEELHGAFRVPTHGDVSGCRWKMDGVGGSRDLKGWLERLCHPKERPDEVWVGPAGGTESNSWKVKTTEQGGQVDRGQGLGKRERGG